MVRLHISDGFRSSMTWLHTWAGIGASCLLFMIFWMGSLSVFDSEIDQWMKPELRVTAPTEEFQYGPVFERLLEGEAHGATRMYISAPGKRDPLGYFFYRNKGGENVRGRFDPATLEEVEVTDSYAGTSFFYPFHYSLHIPQGIGYWVVGFCAMAMLVLMVSGIFIHRKIVADFFTFRPQKALRRSTLDLHNLSSLVALPLHILFPLTGLMIFATIYFPWSYNVVYGGDDAQLNRDAGRAGLEASGEPLNAKLDIDAIVGQALSRWQSAEPGVEHRADSVGLELAGDANAYVIVREVFPSRAVSMSKNVLSVSVATGAILAESNAGPAQSAYAWLSGAHYIQFDSRALRWLYFAGGLLGSVMIASGLMFWMQSRIRKGVIDPKSVRVVRGLAVGSVSGIILASGAYLVVNRMLPAEAAAFGLGRAGLEVSVFYLVWVLTYAHAALRGKTSWAEQSWAIGAVGIAAVFLNWVSTGDHLVATVSDRVWPIAGMDIVLIAGSAAAVWSALKLAQRQPTVQRPSKEQPEAFDQAAARAIAATEPAE